MSKRLLLSLAMSTSIAAFSAAHAAGAGTGAAAAGSDAVSGKLSGGQVDAFAILDQDNDAYIGRNELPADSDLARDFARFDADKDGRLSLTEFSIYASRPAVGAPAEGAPRDDERLGPQGANEGVTPYQEGPTQAPRGVEPGVPGAPPAGSTTDPGGTFGP